MAFLPAVDGFAAASIAVKAIATLAVLFAAGSAMVARLVVPEGRARRLTERLAALAALVAILATGIRLGLRAAFLGGGTLDAAVDPALLSIVVDSPLGTSSIVRAIGVCLVVLVLIPGKVGALLSGFGALLVAASFAMVGHALGEPRLVLGFLVSAHVLAVAFWLGAFAPLYSLAGHASPQDTGAVAQRFGRFAVWAVGGLAAAGVLLVALLVGAPNALADTTYGRLLLLKIGLVTGLVALAAINKERLTPALIDGRADAAFALRRSIALEVAAVVIIVTTTATFTTVARPPAALG